METESENFERRIEQLELRIQRIDVVIKSILENQNRIVAILENGNTKV